MSDFTIRDYRPSDRAAVRHICCATGFMGEPITPYYRDHESFADMFTAYYTDREPQHMLVVEHGGEVVGYVCAALDSRKVPDPAVYALKHVLTRGVCFRPGSAAVFWRGIADAVVSVFGRKRPKVDLDRYPSHTHNNMLPVARGGGGKLTIECFFTLYDRLKQAGSPGLHGDLYASNQRMLHFAEKKLGYAQLGEPYPVPGMRGIQGDRLDGVVMVRDLRDWQVGAWREQLAARNR
jgi:hypothetical protein